MALAKGKDYIMTNDKLSFEIVCAQLLLFTGSYFFLRDENYFTTLFLGIACLYFIFNLFKIFKYSFKSSIFSIVIVISAIFPFINYGSDIDGNLFFSSAYSIDFQQYISVSYSLANYGIPFNNPYNPGEIGYYHYGFLIPFASLLKILDFQKSTFFFYSYSFFCYVLVTEFILFVIIKTLFFEKFKNWLIAICVGVFASSYKGLYGIYEAFHSGIDSSGFDTTIGFKTLQNDLIFGVHYLYSFIFLAFVIKILSINVKQNISYKYIYILAFISFILPSLNAFSPAILFSIFSGYLILRNSKYIWESYKDISVYICLLLLAISYVGMQLLNVHTPGLRMVSIEFNMEVFSHLVFALVINLGPLLILFILSRDKNLSMFHISAIAIVILTLMIAVLTIEQGGEGRFSISRRIGSAITLLLLINININSFDRTKLIVIIPAVLTFIGQNYYFYNGNYISSRTVGISSELFEINRNYYLNNEAYAVSDRYRFNFDIITQAESISYPNSLGATQYNPRSNNRININQPFNAIEIGYENNSFKIVPK
jgi:hypothetical protein